MNTRPTAVVVITVGLSLALNVRSQGTVGPFEPAAPSSPLGLNATTLGVAAVGAMHMVHLSGSPESEFYCAIMVQGLGAGAGGAGSWDLLCGRYDIATDTFTANSDAAALNTTGPEGFMKLHHSGLMAVFERPLYLQYSPPQFATRPTLSSPWQVAGSVWGLPCCGGHKTWRSALTDRNGQLHLVYIQPSWDIALVPFDATITTALGPPTVIVDMPAPVRATNPVPIEDASGEILGVFHSVLGYLGAGSETDRYIALDLDPLTPSIRVSDTVTQTDMSGVAGGRVFFSEWDQNNPSALTRLRAVDSYWTTGGSAPVGGTMQVRMFAPPITSATPRRSLCVASPQFLASGAALAPLQGLVGIDAARAWNSVWVTHNNANGEAVLDIPVPNNPGLSGVRLAAQSVTLDTAGAGALYASNTALLTIQ